MSDIVQTYLPGPSLGKHRPPSMEENGTESSYVDEETRSISFFRSHNTDFFHQIASAMLLVVIWEPGLSLRCLSLSLSLSSAPPKIRVQVPICIHDDDDTTLRLPLPFQSGLSCIRYALTEAINGCHPTGLSIGVA